MTENELGLIVLSVTLFVSTLLIALAAIISGELGSRSINHPNHFVGIRLASTMKSQATWVAAHKASLRPAYFAAVSLVPVGAILLIFVRQNPLAVTVLEGVLFLACCVWEAVAIVAAVKAARAVEAASHKAGTR
ncbi:MAG: SdpI family protein [Propionibacteriaceae bacterium]|jgi:hypothetical protein|nr:SdpI family protein [Propionibacteriaceae bacterium]